MGYAIKFFLMLAICFVIAWIVIGGTFSLFAWGIATYPVATIGFVFVAYLFVKEALR